MADALAFTSYYYVASNFFLGRIVEAKALLKSIVLLPLPAEFVAHGAPSRPLFHSFSTRDECALLQCLRTGCIVKEVCKVLQNYETCKIDYLGIKDTLLIC